MPNPQPPLAYKISIFTMATMGAIFLWNQRIMIISLPSTINTSLRVSKNLSLGSDAKPLSFTSSD